MDKKSHIFIWKESGCDLNKGNNTQKGSCVKPIPSDLAVMTTHIKGILNNGTVVLSIMCPSRG